jgi:hypothetical protein
MAAKLGGSIEYAWTSKGVVIALRMDPCRLADRLFEVPG